MKLIITSPPYNIGKAYEEATHLERYLENLNPIVDRLIRVLAPVAEVVARKPQTTSFTFLTDIGERHVPGYKAPNFCDLMDTAPFAD